MSGSANITNATCDREGIMTVFLGGVGKLCPAERLTSLVMGRTTAGTST